MLTAANAQAGSRAKLTGTSQ